MIHDHYTPDERGAIYNFRLCDACQMVYMFKGIGKKSVMDMDIKYCGSCTDYYFKHIIKIPEELIELKRIELAGKRIIRRKLEQYQIELIREISKTENHESHSIARSIIRNIDSIKEGRYRRKSGETDI